jgi:thermitase
MGLLQMNLFLVVVFLHLLSPVVQAEEFLVKLKPGVSEKSRRQWFGSYKQIRGDVILADISPKRLKQLKDNPRVVKIEPNHKLRLLETTPNDLIDDSWGLKNSSYGFDIRATRAWDISTGSKKIVVAVIDTGIDLRHEDLLSNLWVNQAEANGKPRVDDDNNGYVDDINGYDFALESSSPQDERGHGSHCSGVIGATGNNGRGMVGVNWAVSLMGLKMFPRYSDAKVSDAIRAIDYAVHNGANVINASWGQDDPPHDETYTLLQEAIERANSAGIVFVAAAGNEGKNMDTSSGMAPATMEVPNIVSVGAISLRGQRSSFSSYGQTSVDVFAPGEDILSTVPDSDLEYKSGTSMAAPYVSGIAALMLSVNPNLKPEQMRAIMNASCTANRSLNGLAVCNGHIDAEQAVLKAKALLP